MLSSGLKKLAATATATGLALLALSVPAGLAQDPGDEPTDDPAIEPVVVYDLEFDKSGFNINFDFYDGGYFAAPARGGIGSFVFTKDDGPRNKTYLIVEDAGQLFTAIEPRNKSRRREKVIIVAAGGDGTAASCFMLAGEKDGVVVAPGIGNSVRIARGLTGSGIASDSELDADPARDGSRGFAAVMAVRAGYQNGFSFRANRDGGGVSGAIGDIVEALERFGFVEESAEEEGAGGEDGIEDGAGGDGGPNTGSLNDGAGGDVLIQTN